MEMDFSKLIAKASKNAKECRNKIDKISVEEQERQEKFRRRQEQLLLQQRQQVKKAAKKLKKERQKSPSPKPEKNRIPKLKKLEKSGPSKDAVSSFLAKKSAEKVRSDLDKVKKRDQLLHARIQANGGKISKKIIEQFHMSHEEIRRRTSLFPSQEETQKRREEREKAKNPKADRMHDKFMSEVRSSVSKLKREAELRKNLVPEKRAKLSSKSVMEAKSRQNRSAKPKHKVANPVDFRALMMQEMDDFIDDTEGCAEDTEASLELSRTLKEKFRYDKDKFRHEKYDRWSDAKMEASYGQIAQEEARSSKIAKMEDEIEFLREQQALKAQLKMLKNKR